MKFNIKLLTLLSVLSFVVFSCVDQEDDNLVTYTQSNLERNDEFMKILVNTPVVSFVAGDPGYDVEFLVITPGSDVASKVNVLATFTDAATGNVSNEVVLATYDVAAGQNTTLIQDNYTYAELSEGITINGGSLPADEVEVAVGSTWSLTLSPVNAAGEEVFSAGKIDIAVLSPFAGFYEVIESAYFRIGVESGATDWSGTQIFIGSVDANTFSHVDNWGPFEASGQFVFDLNEDNTITVIDDPSQLFFSGNDMLTCQEDAAMFVNVPCEGSNVLEPQADGRHIIKLTYGYFTTGSGPREFYEVMRKIVD